MKYTFTPEEKEKAFDLISTKFFDRNFGMMSKTDYETLLFHIYIEHLLDTAQDFDDYSISKELGISQSKVRNMKVRKELQYPREGFKWKEAFALEMKKAVYDDSVRQVSVPITDVNVLIELRYFIEKNGWFDIYQLNPKVFCCRIDYFLKLCEKLSDEKLIIDDETEKKLRKIKLEGSNNPIEKICSGALEDGLKELAINASKEVILSVIRILPFGGVAAPIISGLISVLERS